MKRFQDARTSWPLALGCALLASALLLAAYWDRGWIPHDEGTLAHSAERVLQGEIPHKDFDDPYSGGLSVLNALAFKVFGVNLAAMRLMLVGFTLACVPATFYVASRFAGYPGAAAVAFASVVWSVASYPAALPSWYNLFFAMLGTAALLRYIETDRTRWLVAAGVSGGLSIAFKTSGLYFVAAALLLFVFREQSLSPPASDRRSASSIGYSTFVIITLSAFAMSLLFLVRASPGSAQLFQFVLPGAVLAAWLATREFQGGSSADVRFRTLARQLLPFFGGLALVIVPWLGIYAWAGAIGALLNGLFVLPFRRMAFAAIAPVPVYAALAALPIIFLVAGASYIRKRPGRVDAALLIAAAALVVWMAGWNAATYRFIWLSLLTLIPLTVVAGVLLLARVAPTLHSVSDAPSSADVPAQKTQKVMLLLSMAAMINLVQFPFAATVYFCYVAPFALLAVVALGSLLPRPPRMVPAALLALYTAFGLFYVNPGVIYAARLTRVIGAEFEELALDRGGISVPPSHKAEYEQLVAIVRRHARSGYIYAAPDSPEVYFLTGLRNPTRTLFDFFDTGAGRVPRTLAAIDRHGVSVIALNQRPQFSGRLPDGLTRRLRAKFPHSTAVGRFEVRWR